MPTSITLYGGVAEIGGNKILIETAPYAFQTLGETTRSDDDVRPTRLMLDFGLSFRNEKAFYSGFLQPRALSGIADLLKLGILPTLPGIYRDDLLFESGIDPCPPRLDGVLLSHAHADHVAHVPYLDPAIPLYSTDVTLTLLRYLQETGGDAYVSGKRRVPYKNQAKLRKDEKVEWQRATAVVPSMTEHVIGHATVTFCPVDHSAPLTTAILVETSDALIIYSADLRRHGYRAADTDQFMHYARARRDRMRDRGKPTVLLCEGTRFAEAQNATEADVLNDLTRFLAQANVEQRPVIASFSVLDIDRLTSFLRAAKAAGRKLAISPRQFYLVEQLAAILPPAQSGWPDPADPDLRVFFPRKRSGAHHTTDYDKWATSIWHNTHKRVIFTDVQHDPTGYVVFLATSDLNALLDFNLSGQRGLFLYSKSEPHDAEMEVTDQIWNNWCARFNFDRVSSHASGHGAGADIGAIIGAIAPDTLIPIHTEHPQAFAPLHTAGTVGQLIVPQLGTRYDWS
jgi:ribonuclease J